MLLLRCFLVKMISMTSAAIKDEMSKVFKTYLILIMLLLLENIKGGKGHWAVNSTVPSSLIIMFSHLLALKSNLDKLVGFYKLEWM